MTAESGLNFPGKVGYNFLISSFFKKEGEEGEGEGGVVKTEFRGRSFLPVDCMVRSCYYDLSLDLEEEGSEVFFFFLFSFPFFNSVLFQKILPNIHKNYQELTSLVVSFLSSSLRLPLEKIQSEIRFPPLHFLLPSTHY